MAEEHMVDGHGWVSDDSSFYGSDNEQEHQQSLCENINSQSFLLVNDKNPNALRLAARKQRVDNAAAAPTGSRVSALEQIVEISNASPFSMSGAVRKAMEQGRLARQSKLKRTALPEPQPTLELFNFRQGLHDAWQLAETIDDFVNRLPPETTPTSTCPWIWVENPSRHPQDKFASSQFEHFTDSGLGLLQQSLSNRKKKQANGAGVSPGMLTKQLIQESKDLQQRIADLAATDHILTGKWMLFPKSTKVNRVWAQVVQGVIDNRLGCTAKVATDDGNDERLICIYTKDFRDVDDVSGVLAALQAMGLVHPQQTIYYKHDAYTSPGIRSATASKYGLQASLYNSRTLAQTQKLPKPSALPQKQQSKLDKYT